jgi:hypothetical protein
VSNGNHTEDDNESGREPAAKLLLSEQPAAGGAKLMPFLEPDESASRLFDDPGAAAVFGSIMRFAKRLGLFDLAWGARNESHITAHVTEMLRTDRIQSDTIGLRVRTGFSLSKLLQYFVREFDQQNYAKAS